MLHSNRTSSLVGAALLCAGQLAFATVGSVNDAAIGWASQNGGTTGGKGGTEVTVTTIADLQKYAKMSGKYIIWVKGTMGSYGTRGAANGDRVVLSNDKTILGLPGAHIKGGFDLNGVKNIIIRNLIVEGPGAVDQGLASAGEDREDAITIINSTTNVWLDHLDVFDGEDGNNDITKKSDFVTVSWCKFRYTSKSFRSGAQDTSHRYSNLLGGDMKEGSEGKLSVTFYKTWWGEGVAERMPRVRFGKVHVANCLFTSTDAGQSHCIRAAGLANVLVESNVFIGQKKPIDLYTSDKDADSKAVLYTAVTSKNNIFTNCSGNTAGSGTAFTPPYSLTISAASTVQAEVSNATNGAGPTLTWGSTSIGAEPTSDRSVRLESAHGGWTLANTSNADIQCTLLSLDGKQIGEAFTVVAGAAAEIPSSKTARLIQVKGRGETQTLQAPGF
jgi:pectate lyase